MPGPGIDTDGMAMVLRASLSVLAPLLLAAVVGGLIYQALTPAGASPAWSLLLPAVPAVAAALVMSRRPLTLRQLQGLEIALAAAIAVFLAAAGASRIGGNLLAGNVAAARSDWNVTVLQFVAFVILYGLLVPGTRRRSTATITALAAAPFAILLYVRVRHGEWLPVAAAALQLALAAAAALVGGKLIGRTRSGYLNAAKMGMYNLIEKIGSGGMGEVWLARHELLARPAAIKLIRPELLGETPEAGRIIQRFEREARATARLRSQHTVELYDFGVAQTGVFYYVMEYLDGLDLATLVERFGTLPAGRAVHVLRQICESLRDAHASGLIHRDIKPANIHVCRLGSRSDFVKVLDFGLVKFEGDEKLDEKLTQEGTTTGTPAYMAPETVTKRNGYDPRTDIYSLGCVGYWLLSGKPPFEAETPMGMIVEHAKTVPAPVSARTEIPVPEELDRILLKCLEKDPAQRFQSARELAVALAGCPVPEPWTEERADRWWATHFPSVREEAPAVAG